MPSSLQILVVAVLSGYTSTERVKANIFEGASYKYFTRVSGSKQIKQGVLLVH